jgi:shikimate dehydrogenase
MHRAVMSSPTRCAFLLGEHISHSLSPAIHNAAFAALGLDYEYGLLDVPPAGLQDALARMRRPDCLGGNVTMPYKSAVLAMAEGCSETVGRCGAASLLINRDGRFFLENNDVEAIAACLSRRAATLSEGPAVIVGAGGSAAAMLEALRRAPPTRVLVLARRFERAAALVERFRGWLPVPVEAGLLEEDVRSLLQAGLIMNATPLGVHAGDPSPVPRQALRPGLLVYDVVYRREGLSRLQSEAQAAGALICDGMAHIFEQAPFTFRMLTGLEAPREVMLESLVAATGRRPLDWGSDVGASARG